MLNLWNSCNKFEQRFRLHDNAEASVVNGIHFDVVIDETLLLTVFKISLPVAISRPIITSERCVNTILDLLSFVKLAYLILLIIRVRVIYQSNK